MKKILRPYQQDVLNKLILRLRENANPTLVNASVGAGKSLIISELLHIIEKAGWRALCLTMNSSLIEQNAKTYESQGHNPGVFCAGLERQDYDNHVIFASPHSLISAFKKEHLISKVFFNLIVIDECHNINYKDKNSMYMRILNNYANIARNQQDETLSKRFRVVGLTGTPYRMEGKSIESIIATPEELELYKDPIYRDKKGVKLFHDQVCEISTTWLIDNGFLVPPKFGKTQSGQYDMKDIKIRQNGKFDKKDLQDVVDKNVRLTEKIMKEIVSVVESEYHGAFIFASTVEHAKECFSHLPENQSTIITAETNHLERQEILEKARNGLIKYLVNVQTLLVGVDVPNFDVCAWLRPTESLILYTQGIGRVLRLHEGKDHCLILDFAGNVERHQNADDLIVKDCIEDLKTFILNVDEEELVIQCPQCNAMNKETARRCRGIKDKVRCDYYFTFKECPNNECEALNDITARNCRLCRAEIIDPNKKLKLLKDRKKIEVIEASYWLKPMTGRLPIVCCKYTTKEGMIYENYFVSSEKAKNYFYARFVKKHIENFSTWYNRLDNENALRDMIYNHYIKTPNYLICDLNENGQYTVYDKLFDQP